MKKVQVEQDIRTIIWLLFEMHCSFCAKTFVGLAFHK
jgi:hypothetical protein